MCNALNHYTGTVIDLCINLWRATFVSNLSKKSASLLFVESMESLLYYLSENIMDTWMQTSNVTPQNATVMGFEGVL